MLAWWTAGFFTSAVVMQIVVRCGFGTTVRDIALAASGLSAILSMLTLCATLIQ